MRCAQAGSTFRPRRCSRSRTSRCRTRVTIRFASCTRWNGSTLICAFGSCSVMALPERRRRVDRDHLDPVPPRRAAGGQPAADGGGVAAVDDAEDLTGVGVHDRRHPRLDPPPATVTRRGTSGPGGSGARRCRAAARAGRPRRAAAPPRRSPWPAPSTTPPRRSAATSATARPESITAASTAVLSRVVHRARAGSWLGRRGERPPRTRRLGAHQPGLADHHLDPAGVRDVPDPLHDPGVHPRRHHPTRRAAVRQINRLHLDPATAQRQIDRVDHPVAGQVEDHARSVTPRARRLEQARGPSSMDA